MFTIPTRYTSTALALVLCAGTAQADLTPVQIWGDWQSYLQSMGYDLNATETVSGDTLTVSDITMGIALGEAGVNMTASLGEVSFAQNADGSVQIIVPGSMPISAVGTAEGEDDVTIAIRYDQEGQSIVASGTPENISYTHTADNISVTLEKVIADGTELGPENILVAFKMTDVDSQTRMTLEDLRTYRQSGTAGSLQFDVAIFPPDASGDGMKMQGEIAGLTFDGTSLIPLEEIDSQNLTKMLDAGFGGGMNLTYESSQIATDFKDPNGSAQMTQQSEGGDFEVSISAAGLIYGGSARNGSTNIKVPDFPFPVSVEMAEAAFRLAFPIKSSQDPQDFSLGLTMADFTISDVIWGLFDPAGQLPRDPATIDLDLSGTAKLLFDMFDSANIEGLGTNDTQPGSLETLSINRLLVQLVGAKLSGDGSFTFDNSDLETFGGMPRPTGKVDLELVGGNTLLDKLVAMGFVPQEQAMGARMMMGLFTVPTDVPDTLTSTLEINDQGHVLANGQRIQ